MSPFAGKVWTDAEGTTWTRRGSQVSTSRVRHLMGRVDVTVMHAYAGDLVHVPVPEREALWCRVEPYLRDLAREQGDHTDVLVGEFRSASGGSLLMLEERC